MSANSKAITLEDRQNAQPHVRSQIASHSE